VALIFTKKGNQMKAYTPNTAILATLVSCAQAHIEDIETGIEEGLYVEAENTDLQSKKDAVEAVSLLLQPHTTTEFPARITPLERPQPASECSECGVESESIIGCPSGAEICHDCFDTGTH
jgi:hypothetical protein